MNLISGLATKSKAAKKDDKPTVFDPSLSEPIAIYIARKQEAETAQALCDAAKEQIVSAVRPRRLEACRAAGKVLSSVSINGILTFTQTCRYSNVAEERKGALTEAFNGSFDRYFADTLAIGLKKESANDESVLCKLLESLGQDFFAEHFDVRRDLIVKDAFHNDYSTREEVQAIAEPFIDEQTIKPYAPSLKIK
jgi:hypothetical protein